MQKACIQFAQNETFYGIAFFDYIKIGEKYNMTRKKAVLVRIGAGLQSF